MAKPLGFYVSAVAGTSDADILDRIQEEFGPRLEELSCDDKASVLICLIDAAINPQQVFVGPNFFSCQNGKQLWQLAQKLSTSSKLDLSVAIAMQLTNGG